MLLTRRIVSDCSRFVRQFYVVNSLAQQSSSVVVPSSECMIGCLNMTSRQHGTESDATEQKQKDNVQQSPEDEDCQTSAKRLKVSDSSLENAVGVTSHKFYNNTVTHTHVKQLFSRTTRVSRYQKGKTNLYFTEARDSEWQWHHLGCMQVCSSLDTDNHASTPPLSFLLAGCPSCCPTNSVKALKA